MIHQNLKVSESVIRLVLYMQVLTLLNLLMKIHHKSYFQQYMIMNIYECCFYCREPPYLSMINWDMLVQLAACKDNKILHCSYSNSTTATYTRPYPTSDFADNKKFNSSWIWLYIQSHRLHMQLWINSDRWDCTCN